MVNRCNNRQFAVQRAHQKMIHRRALEEISVWVRAQFTVRSLFFSTLLVLIAVFVPTRPALSAETAKEPGKSGRTSTGDRRSQEALPTFAPLPPEHPLASIWNDPEFARRVYMSYGFLSEREPKLTPQEQTFYRENLVPVLRETPEKAIPLLEKHIKPDSSALFDYTLGTLYFQQGDNETAIRHLKAALAKFPDFLRAQRNLALALVRAGRYSDAIPELTRTVALGGGDGKIYGLLAFAQSQENRFLSAAASYQQALLYEPDNTEFHLGLARCYLATANYSAALSIIDELIARNPENDSFWALRANIYLHQNALDDAAVTLEFLRRSGKATPANLTALGDVYAAQGIPDLAWRAYSEAAQLDGWTNITRTLRALDVLVSRSAWEQCEQLIRQIKQMSGINLEVEEEIKLLRLEARVALATNKDAEAIEILERILLRNPLDGEALLMAGDYYKQKGDFERAALRYDAAAKIDAFEATALVKHAQLLVEQGRYAQAVELLRRSQRIAPRDSVQRYLEKVEQVAARSRN